jgi:hypothetical protein
MSSWWNDRGHVGLESGSYARSRPSHQREWVPWLGNPVAPCLARGLHVSLGRGESMLRGSGAFVLTLSGSGALMTLWGLG